MSEQKNFHAVVDVTAPAGAFSVGFQLALQNHLVPILAVPSGLHAETNISVDKDKILVFFDAPSQDGVDWSFKITLTPLQGGNPSGPAISWSTSGTTSPDLPARLKGFVPLSAFKPDSAAAAKPDKNKKENS